jgi:DNA-binding transcriptional LysR family regulator
LKSSRSVTVRTAHLGNASRIRPRRDSRPTSSTGPRIVSDRIFHDHHRLELVTHHPVIEPVSWIGCPESLTAGFLPAVIDRLSRRYPQIVIYSTHVESGNTEFREIRERHIDLMLARVSESFLDNELDAEILFRERYFVTAGANSPWVRRRKIELAELANEPWIQMPAETSINAALAEAFQAHGLDLPRKSVGLPVHESSQSPARNRSLSHGPFGIDATI